jgi:hypothetical protein
LYLIAALVILWCVDFKFGARLGVWFLASVVLNAGFKDWLKQPRPCDLRPAVCVEAPGGYGLPSGHAQNALVFWGILADGLQTRRAWVSAIGLTTLIGFSRIYLGVHFPTDVLGGWLIGLVLLAAFNRVAPRLERALAFLSTGVQVLLAGLLAGLAVALDPSPDIVAAAPGLAGFAAGLALSRRYVPFDAGGSYLRRLLRFGLGLLGVGVLYVGLWLLFPQEGEPFYFGFHLLRYGLVGLWVSFGALWVFRRLNLASGARDRPDGA